MEVEVKVDQGGRSNRRGNIVGASTCDHWSLNKHTDRQVHTSRVEVCRDRRSCKFLPAV